MPRAPAAGIDISFAMHLPPSTVERCTVRGGLEGIVSNLAHVRFVDNVVTGTTLRAITVGEMSMGEVDRNEVRDALGVGIFCGDYSHCRIRDNDVVGMRADPGSASRAGYAVVSHYGSHAWVSDTEGKSGGVHQCHPRALLKPSGRRGADRRHQAPTGAYPACATFRTTRTAGSATARSSRTR